MLIGLVAGVYVDRWNRKMVMVASDLLRGILVLGHAAGSLAGFDAVHVLEGGRLTAVAPALAAA